MSPSDGTVLIADDHELFSAALVGLLERDLGISQVLTASTLDETLNLLAENTDIRILGLDLSMPGMEGLESAVMVRKLYPHLLIMIITASNKREDVIRVVSSGIQGYIPKSLRTKDIVRAFRTVIEGNIYIPPDLLKIDLNTTANANDAGASSIDNEAFEFAQKDLRKMRARIERLTARQRAVVKLIAEGKSNKEIARALGLAEGTVKVHVGALFRTLEVHTRAQAVAALTVLARSRKE